MFSVRGIIICLIALSPFIMERALAVACFNHTDPEVRDRGTPFRSDCAYLVQHLQKSAKAQTRMVFSSTDIPIPHQKVPQQFQWQSCVVTMDLETGITQDIASLRSIGGTLDMISQRCVAYGSSPPSPADSDDWLLGYGGHANCGDAHRLKVSVYGPPMSSTLNLTLPVGMRGGIDRVNVTANM